ncbi:MAG: cytochrome c biogenesis protein CcsA [candidate division WOR-3 bacterium]
MSALGRSRVGTVLSAAGIVAHLSFVFVRAASIGHLPFASRFEATALFALSIAVCGLALSVATRHRPTKAATNLIAATVLLVCLLVFGFQPSAPLNPILASRWFASHILFAFAGYGMLACGLVWSITIGQAGVARRLALAVVVLLGTGILLGTVWADESWGSYWSWDPKESWALLTWVLMVAFVHVAGTRPRRWTSIIFFALGCLAMLFTFIGINLLRFGLHRYG